MKIIALYGHGNLGKTGALNCVIDKLCAKPGTTVKSIKHYVNADQVISLVVIPQSGVPVDVGVTTFGDTDWELIRDFGLLSDCEIVFCAARTYGKTVEFLKKRESAGDELIWKQQPYYSKSDIWKTISTSITSSSAGLADARNNLMADELIASAGL